MSISPLLVSMLCVIPFRRMLVLSMNLHKSTFKAMIKDLTEERGDVMCDLR